MVSTSRTLQSKKFVAYLVAEATWKILAALVLIFGAESIGQASLTSIMMTIILVAGFVEVMFIGSQATLDKYVRLASIAAKSSKAPPEDKS